MATSQDGTKRAPAQTLQATPLNPRPTTTATSPRPHRTALAGAALAALATWGTPVHAVAPACTNGINATSTCTLPANTVVSIEVWGAGGGGSRTNGDGSNSAYSGGGGGGGGYCRYTVTTGSGSPGLNIAVGAGGRAGSQSHALDHGEAGGGSSVVYTPSSGPTVTVSAAGGGGAQLGDMAPGAAGTGAGGSGGSGCPALSGATSFSGGAGGSGAAMAAGMDGGGGGGGSSAGTAANGNNGGAGTAAMGGGSAGSGGAAPTGGGAGGAGGLFGGSSAGSAPGGGGGGGGYSMLAMGSIAPSDGGAGRVNVTWSGADVTAPTLSSVGVSGTTTSATTLAGTSNEAATGYWVLQSGLVADPSASQVKNGLTGAGFAAPQSGSGSMVAATGKTFAIGGLSASTLYKACLMAEDAAANASSVTCADFTSASPPDAVAPVLSGVGATANASGATLTGTSTENGSIYWVVLDAAASVPGDAAAVKNHTGAIKWGSNTHVTASTPASFWVYGLAPSTPYRLCMVAEDAALNPSAVSCATFRTATAAVSGQCGPAHATGPMLNFPSSPDLCSMGTLDMTSVVPAAEQLKWGCSGQNGGSTAACYAVRGYSVTPTTTTGVGMGNAQVVAYGQTTTFTVKVADGYQLTAGSVTGCNGQFDTATSVFTTGPVTASCTVNAAATSGPPTPAKVTPVVSGGNDALTVTAQLVPSSADRGKVGTIYVAAVVNSVVYLQDSAGSWLKYEPSNPAAFRTPVTLGDMSLDVLSHLDVRAFVGANVYVGYGLGTPDQGAAVPFNNMLVNGSYLKLTTITAKTASPSGSTGRATALAAPQPQVARYAVEPRATTVAANGRVMVTITALDANGHADLSRQDVLDVATLLPANAQGLPQHGRVSPSRVALVHGTATVWLSPASVGTQKFVVTSADRQRQGWSMDLSVHAPRTPVFTDIGTSAARDEVMELFHAGVVSGAGRYRPTAAVTREQLALTLARAYAAVKPAVPPADAVYTDLAAGSAVHRSAHLLAALGVPLGCGGSSFCPHGSVTRWELAQALAQLHRALGGTDPATTTTPYADLAGLAAPAARAVAQAHALGVVSGTTPVTFDPQAAASRDSMAASVARLLRLVHAVPATR